MPADSVSCVQAPDAAVVWLLQGGLSPEQADAWGIRWHEKLQRLLLPVHNVDRVYSGLLARGVYNEKPKYTMLQGSPGYYFTEDLPGKLVLVEDILSSIAVHRAGYCGAALIGTTATVETLHALVTGHKEVVVWTDPDVAGRKAVNALLRKLSLLGVETTVAKSDVDPKYLSVQEIKRTVETAQERFT
jgi:DNA primase